MIKNHIFIACLILGLVGAGCGVFRVKDPVTKNQAAIAKEEKKIGQTSLKLEKNSDFNQKQASALAAGTQISLNQITNPPPQIVTAKSLNMRVLAILGEPNLDDLLKVEKMVFLLNSAIEEERNKGILLLAEKDRQLILLQKQKSDLNDVYDAQIASLTAKAGQIAKTADQNKALVDEINSFWGLKAVFYGMRRFLTISLWFLIGGFVLYVLLRVFASSSPLISAAFGFIESFGAIAIKTVTAMAPNASKLANLIPKEDGAKYKRLITKVVDNICELRFKQDLIDKKYTLDEILLAFSEDMDQSEKDLITELEKATRWKK